VGAQTTAPSDTALAPLVKAVRFERMDKATYARVVDEPIMQSLTLMKVVAKCVTGARPPRFELTKSRGVQLTLDGAFLDRFTKHLDVPYTHPCTSEELDDIPESARCVFVGARDPSGKIALGAFAPRHIVVRRTERDKPHEHNGVFWYFTSKESFGFAPTSEIDQCAADVCEDRGEERLSWHIDGDDGDGGWRAGVATMLGSEDDDESWHKLVYYV